MGLLQQHYEKHTNGTAVTTANSDDFGDDPFNAGMVNGMTMTYDTSQAAHGTVSVRFGGGTTSGDYAGQFLGAYSTTQAVTRLYARFTGLPSAGTSFFQFRDTNGSAILAELQLNANGTVTVNQGGSTAKYTTTAVFGVNAWYRFEFALNVATTGGQIKFSAFTGDSTALAYAAYDSGATLNTGTTLIGSGVFGKLDTASTMGDIFLDDWAIQDGSLAFLGPYLPGPVLIAQPNQGVAVIDCTQSYAGVTGDSITYSISPSTGTSQPARGVFLVPESPDTVTYTVTATESNGRTDAQVVSVPGQLPGGLGIRSKQYRSGTWV